MSERPAVEGRRVLAPLLAALLRQRGHLEVGVAQVLVLVLDVIAGLEGADGVGGLGALVLQVVDVVDGGSVGRRLRPACFPGQPAYLAFVDVLSGPAGQRDLPQAQLLTRALGPHVAHDDVVVAFQFEAGNALEDPGLFASRGPQASLAEVVDPSRGRNELFPLGWNRLQLEASFAFVINHETRAVIRGATPENWMETSLTTTVASAYNTGARNFKLKVPPPDIRDMGYCDTEMATISGVRCSTAIKLPFPSSGHFLKFLIDIVKNTRVDLE